MQENQGNENAVGSSSSKIAFYVSLTAIVVLMFFLTFNTGDWRVVSQQSYNQDQCRIDIQDNAFQVTIDSEVLNLDSLRINLTHDSTYSTVTVTSCQRDMLIIGEPDKTLFAEITLLAPQICSSSFTLHNRL